MTGRSKTSRGKINIHELNRSTWWCKLRRYTSAAPCVCILQHRSGEMANKRQNKDSPKCTTTAKKSKSEESEFNGTVFKSMLKDPSKELKGKYVLADYRLTFI